MSKKECDAQNERLVGYNVVNQCLCIVLKIWRQQKDMNANNLTKEQLQSERVTRLLKVVQYRKERLAWRHYKEKYDEEPMPYNLVSQVHKIADLLLSKHHLQK